MTPQELVRELLEYVDPWVFEDGGMRGGGDSISCNVCGAHVSSHNHEGTAEWPEDQHLSGCKLKALIEEARAFADGGAR